MQPRRDHGGGAVASEAKHQHHHHHEHFHHRGSSGGRARGDGDDGGVSPGEDEFNVRTSTFDDDDEVLRAGAPGIDCRSATTPSLSSDSAHSHTIQPCFRY
jgi:hypothetical protein